MVFGGCEGIGGVMEEARRRGMNQEKRRFRMPPTHIPTSQKGARRAGVID